MDEKKVSRRGGKRKNSGRKPNSGRYGEPTRSMRIPISLLPQLEPVMREIEDQNKRKKHDASR